MNDVLIECFRAAAKTLSFTAAAQKIHISQPSFSRNIALMEQEIGFPLFVRNKQEGIRLTAAGSVFYRSLEKLEAEYKEHLELARQISRGEQGKLVIGILNGTCLNSENFNYIKKFQDNYPKVEIVTKSFPLKGLEDSLLKGTSDICFIMADIIENREQILHRKICTMESFFVVPGHLGMDETVEHSLVELKDLPFILSEDFPAANQLIIDACIQSGFEPEIIMAPDHETRLLWAEMGKGVAGDTADHYLRYSSHVSFIKIKEVPDLEYSIAWNKADYNPGIALFCSMLDDIFE